MASNTPTIAKDVDDRIALGTMLRNLVQAGLDQKGSAPDWWAECEAFHRNEMPVDEDEDDALVPLHIPFSQPRQDSLTAQVCSTLTRPDPIMQVETSAEQTVGKTLEKLVHKFWRAASFESKVRRASSICTDTNLVVFRLAFDDMPNRMYGGLVFDVVHPKHFVIYPATIEGIQGARLVGHRFYRRLRDVRAMQQTGVYFNDTPVTGSNTRSATDRTGEIANSGANPDASTPEQGDLPVQLFEVCVRLSSVREDMEKLEPEKWYIATIAFDQGVLLSITEFPYSRPWYFDAYYVIGNDEAYYPGVSVARHLSFIQDLQDKEHSGFYNGAMNQAYPPIFGPKLNEKDFRYRFGEYVSTEGEQASSFYSPMIRFDGRPMVDHLEMTSAIGDQVARISPNTMGAQQERDVSATETSIIASGVGVGIEEYIGNFSSSFGDMAAFTIELLKTHWDKWAPRYAQQLGIAPEMLSVPQLWEPTGKSPGSTPAAKIAAIDKLFQAAQMFGPASGLDPYEIVRALIPNLPLQGVDGVQIPKDEMLQRAQQQQQAQNAAQQPQPNQLSGSPQAPGMATPPELPPQADFAGAGPVPPDGSGPELSGYLPTTG